jgi:hypothetical protein
VVDVHQEPNAAPIAARSVCAQVNQEFAEDKLDARGTPGGAYRTRWMETPISPNGIAICRCSPSLISHMPPQRRGVADDGMNVRLVRNQGLLDGG